MDPFDPTGEFSHAYTTAFEGTENPISEGGAWSHVGLDWACVRKRDGIAFGTQTGVDGYNDSYALMSGFPPDQTASGIVHLVDDMDTSCSREVLLLLRWTDSAHSAKGYECLFAWHGAIQIVRWNGPYGDFTYLADVRDAPPVEHGDLLQASVIGNVITIYRNGEQRVQITDDSYAIGNPGIGMFRRDCGCNSDFGYTRFTATGRLSRR
jgi:hypothetical protein